MTANELVANAKDLIGVRYVWGGSAPTQGLDCSGLLYWIQRVGGSNVARLTASGYSKLGKKISSFYEAKPGDFLFFGSPVTHCAVYIGYGYMIESRGGRKNTASNPGIGVVKSLVSRRSDLSCIRRVWSSSPSYVVGRTYRTQVDHLHVRYSVWGQIKGYAQLTADGMKHAYSDGCLKKGTTVTVKDIKKDEVGATWVRIPSGWICAVTSMGGVYVS